MAVRPNAGWYMHGQANRSTIKSGSNLLFIRKAVKAVKLSIRYLNDISGSIHRIYL